MEDERLRKRVISDGSATHLDIPRWELKTPNNELRVGIAYNSFFPLPNNYLSPILTFGELAS